MDKECEDNLNLEIQFCNFLGIGFFKYNCIVEWNARK